MPFCLAIRISVPAPHPTSTHFPHGAKRFASSTYRKNVDAYCCSPWILTEDMKNQHLPDHAAEQLRTARRCNRYIVPGYKTAPAAKRDPLR